MCVSVRFACDVIKIISFLLTLNRHQSFNQSINHAFIRSGPIGHWLGILLTLWIVHHRSTRFLISSFWCQKSEAETEDDDKEPSSSSSPLIEVSLWSDHHHHHQVSQDDNSEDDDTSQDISTNIEFSRSASAISLLFSILLVFMFWTWIPYDVMIDWYMTWYDIIWLV
jgi:hypothetical protein